MHRSCEWMERNRFLWPSKVSHGNPRCKYLITFVVNSKSLEVSFTHGAIADNRHWPDAVRDMDLFPSSKVSKIAFIMLYIASIWSKKSTPSSKRSPASMFSISADFMEKLPGTNLFLLWNKSLLTMVFPYFPTNCPYDVFATCACVLHTSSVNDWNTFKPGAIDLQNNTLCMPVHYTVFKYL